MQDKSDRNSASEPDSEPDESELTVAEAAALLSVSARTVRRYAASGRLPARRIRGERGEELRFQKADVEACREPDTLDKEPDRDADTLDKEGGQEPDTLDKDTDTPDSAAAVALAELEAERCRRIEAEAALNQVMRSLLVERERAARLEAEGAAAVEAKERSERDVDFLRQQVDNHARAEEQLRVLMLRQSEQIQALQAGQQRALPESLGEKPTADSPPAPVEPKRPWWRFW